MAFINQETIIELKHTSPGEFIKRKNTSTKMYIRGHYDRATKTYSLIDWEDINREIFLKGTTKVFVGFTF
jgi:ribosomal protein L31E